MLAEYVLVTLICTTMDKPCDSYTSKPMTSTDCEILAEKVLLTAQQLDVKETILTYCTNIQREEL